MINTLKEFPFTTILSILGFLIGTVLGSGFGVFTNYDLSGIVSDPASSFANYFGDFLVTVIEGSFFGIVLGIIMGLIGLVIDFSRREDFED